MSSLSGAIASADRPLQAAEEYRRASHSGTRFGSSRIAIWLAGLFLLCFGYFLPLPDADAGARLDTTLAIVQRHTVAIDAYRWNTTDVAFYHGHFYSVTAPGQALLGVPLGVVYMAAVNTLAGHRAAADTGRKTWDGRLSYFILQYLEGMAMGAIPATFLLILFFWFLGYFSSSWVNRVALTVALGLGTMVFPYGHAFYAHVPVAALLFAGFVLIYVLGHPEAPRGPQTRWLVTHPQFAAFLVGFLLGLAEVFEYPVALISLFIALYAVPSLPRRLIPYLIAGGLPGLLVVMGYDYAAYHNPFVTGYSSNSVSYKKELGHGLLAALRLPPPPAALYGSSFSPFRGLFFLSPFLLLAFPGLILWARRARRVWILCLAIPVAYFLAMATYPIWYAGDAIGPRFLIPVLPFLALPVIFTLEGARRWTTRLPLFGLMAISAIAVWLEALGTRYGYPDAKNHNPLFTYSLPHVLRGDLMPSLGSPIFGMSSKAAILPLFVLIVGWSFALLRPVVSTRPAAGDPSGAARRSMGVLRQADAE